MISLPTGFFQPATQAPAATSEALDWIFLASPSSRPKVCSATVVWLTPGVKRIGSSCAVAWPTSILSRPMPYLLIALSLGRDLSITAAVIASSPQRNPSNSPASASISSSGSGPRARATSHPVPARRSWCSPGVSW